MVTKTNSLEPVDVTPGVQPSTDKTALSTPHWTMSDKVRFVNGKPKKIGGWISFDFDEGNTVSGYARTLFSALLSTSIRTLIGTHTKLYSLIGSSLTNITPLSTTTVSVASSFATHYTTLGNNPITTTSGSLTVVVTDSDAPRFLAGDFVTLSGADTTGGVTMAALNTQHLLRAVSTGSYTIRVTVTASSGVSGGGASVIRSSGFLRVTSATHGMSDGDRVKLANVTTVGGIGTADINLEFLTRNTATSTFDVMTAGTATSSTSSQGGASATYQAEIADGEQSGTLGQGYGMGEYGVGLYGVSKISASTLTYPRIWFLDRFGNNIYGTPGNGTGLYEWTGTTATAPTLVTNAPTAINYFFVSNSIGVTFGAGGTTNRIYACDQGAITTWTGSSTNQVFDDNVEGAGRLITHCPCGDFDLIYTEQQCYTFRYIGLPLIWDIKPKDLNTGIIGPMARVNVNGTAYWMAQRGNGVQFYMCDGGEVEVIPANTQAESTILRYVNNSINMAQKYKIFAWFNSQYNEIWWHYPSAESDEPDRIARVCLNDYTWTPDTMARTAAEYPNMVLTNPRLMNIGTLYKHEFGSNDDGSAMAFYVNSNLRSAGKASTLHQGFIPDSTTNTGDLTVTVSTKRFPQSSTTAASGSYTVTPTSERIATMLDGRYWQYQIAGTATNQEWQMGEWEEYIQKGADN